MSATLSDRPSPKKLLIADDDPGVLRFLADRCQRLGFEVETAKNGLQAIVIANRFHPDVLILDINMPQIDGLSVAGRLLAPKGPTPDVIVITASSFPDTEHRCLSFGATHVRKGAALMEGVEAALRALFPDLVAGGTDPAATSAGPAAWILPRILIVDDDPSTGRLLSSRLLKYGVETLLARDGVRGHDAACRHEPSLVMVRHSMRGGDIAYLLQKLRSTAKTETVPIIIFGDEIDDADRARLMRFEHGKGGLLIFLPGPLSVDTLFAEIQKICAFSIDPNGFGAMPVAAWAG